MRLIRRRQAGDTIVEVLIAIAVIALVLGGAYTATNRSLKISRASQERSEALKVAETQVERLKYLKDSGTWIEPAGVFCIKADGVSIENIEDIAREPNCTFEGLYTISIQKDGHAAYQVRAIWPNVTSTSSVTIDNVTYPGVDQLQLFYRINDSNLLGVNSATTPSLPTEPTPTPQPTEDGHNCDDTNSCEQSEDGHNCDDTNSCEQSEDRGCVEDGRCQADYINCERNNSCGFMSTWCLYYPWECRD